MLLLHYTGVATAAKAIDWLSRDREQGIGALRHRRGRRHHAAGGGGACAPGTRALAVWAGETDINSASIGIEVHNPGHEFG